MIAPPPISPYASCFRHSRILAIKLKDTECGIHERQLEDKSSPAQILNHGTVDVILSSIASTARAFPLLFS